MLRFRGFGGFRVSGIHFFHSLVVARLLPSRVAATRRRKWLRAPELNRPNRSDLESAAIWIRNRRPQIASGLKH